MERGEWRAAEERVDDERLATRGEERGGEEKMGGRERERGGGRMVVELGKRESEGEARGSEDRRWWKREETIGV